MCEPKILEHWELSNWFLPFLNTSLNTFLESWESPPPAHAHTHADRERKRDILSKLNCFSLMVFTPSENANSPSMKINLAAAWMFSTSHSNVLHWEWSLHWFCLMRSTYTSRFFLTKTVNSYFPKFTDAGNSINSNSASSFFFFFPQKANRITSTAA